MVKSGLNLNICVCVECVSELCLQQIGCSPLSVEYIDGKPQGSINFSELSNNQFCLLQLMDSISCFDFVETNLNLIQIHKLQSIKDKMEVLLIKPTLIPNAPSSIIQFKDFEDMHDISSYRLHLTKPIKTK